MIILGIDPSTEALGWAVLDFDEPEETMVVASGTHVVKGKTLDDKLDDIGSMSRALVRDYGAWHMAIEMPVLHSRHRNVVTLRTLAQVVGVVRYVAYEGTTQIIEIQPAERRLALGVPIRLSNDAACQQIRRIVKAVFGVEAQTDHEADAIAVAYAAVKKMKAGFYEC